MPTIVSVTSGLIAEWCPSQGVTTAGSDVTALADLTGNGNHTLSVFGAPQLVDPGLNGEPIITMDGVDDALVKTNGHLLVSGAGGRTVVQVVRYNGFGNGGFSWGSAADGAMFGLCVATEANGGNLLIQRWGASNDELSGTVGTGAGWLVQAVRWSVGGNWYHYKGHAVIDSGTGAVNATSSTGSIKVGAQIDNNPRVQMDMAHIAVWNRVLSLAELTTVIAQMGTRYALDVGEPPEMAQPTQAAERRNIMVYRRG